MTNIQVYFHSDEESLNFKKFLKKNFDYLKNKYRHEYIPLGIPNGLFVVSIEV